MPCFQRVRYRITTLPLQVLPQPSFSEPFPLHIAITTRSSAWKTKQSLAFLQLVHLATNLLIEDFSFILECIRGLKFKSY